MANDFGTLEWARKTKGRLTAPQALAYTTGLVKQQRRIISSHPSGGPIDPRINTFRVGTSDLTLEIERYAHEKLDPPILAHSQRVRLIAHCVTPREDEVNPDLLTAACLLHDAGLTRVKQKSRPRRECFTLRSADVAIDILERAGVDSASITTVAEAIVAHMNVDLPANADPLAVALQTATHLDVVGARAAHFSAATLESVQHQYPRQGFTSCFSSSFRREIVPSPFSRAALSWVVGLPIAMRLNPIDRVARPQN